MNRTDRTFIAHNSNPALPPGRFFDAHALVIGGGIAGLTAARVLADYFTQVTLIERDALDNAPELRQGVPQARHAHTLLPRGQLLLEQYFPGLVNDLLSKGAVPINPTSEIAFFKDGCWRTPHTAGQTVSIACSRPLLEAAIFQRITDHPAIRVMAGYQVAGLTADEHHKRVVGVRLIDRQVPNSQVSVHSADLVIDASGRNSQAPQWLSSLGIQPPEEWVINSYVGYTTRVYQSPDLLDRSWKTLYVRPSPPRGTRGGIILPMEGNRWNVTLIGVARDFPPTDEDGFIDFARSLPTSTLFDAIIAATPLSKPSGFRRTENRVRRFDRLPRYLEGFLVMGDAAYTLNPIYAQGMTAAALSSQALAASLSEQTYRMTLDGLASAFQRNLSAVVGGLWHSTVTKEWSWPVTELDDNTETLYPFDQDEPPSGQSAARNPSASDPIHDHPAIVGI